MQVVQSYGSPWRKERVVCMNYAAANILLTYAAGILLKQFLSKFLYKSVRCFHSLGIGLIDVHCFNF